MRKLKFKKILVLILFLVGTQQNGVSQQNLDCACCSEDYKAFDFWLGDWMVYDTLGNAIGSNTILKMQKNCVIQENWHSSSSTGTSYNFYNRKDKKWHQVWIDSNGGVLELSGILVDKSMVLRSEIQSAKNGDFYHRITWTPMENGEVVQHWEQVNPQNLPIKTLFKGIYKRNVE